MTSSPVTAPSQMTIANGSRRAASMPLRRVAVALLPLAVAIALAIVGAFGSYVAMGLPVRLLHFCATAIVIGAPAFGISEALRLTLFPRARPLWAALLTAAALAPPGAVVVQQSLRLFAPHVLPYVSLIELTLQVLVINVTIGTASWALLREADRPEERAPAREERDAASTSGALRAKLPPALRHAMILALSAEDHYVRVRTDRGQALILMNLGDAIAALGPESGVRIHRSHWIAYDLVASATRCGVQLNEATLLPISRAGWKQLREHAERALR
ncbi:MAG: LytTR family transcriptional regulator [Methylobacteriaceae bacterium]|nr:LytTR family transcriptional regulator [Methylobacteriaceae bacterium]